MNVILERKKRLPRPHMNGPRLVKVELEVSSRTGKNSADRMRGD